MTRVCLLTGASGPLGTTFIHACSERYAIVAVHHDNPVHHATQDQQLVDPLDPDGPVPGNATPVHAVRVDLRDAGEIDRLATSVASEIGPVDLVVNAAAVRTFAHVLDRDALRGADDVMAVNVLAPLRLAAALAAACWSADPDANVAANRNVVNVSSTAGLYVYPDYGQALYATSKAALNHLTYHLASDLWDLGIRVNAVAPDTFPGRVPTDAVIDAIIDLDESTETGRVVAVEPSTGIDRP